MPLSFDWEGIPICVSHTENWLKDQFDHLEIRSDCPNPITETGYKSHFIQQSELALFEGPEDFVRQWLDLSAKSPEWKASQFASRQLSLF